MSILLALANSKILFIFDGFQKVCWIIMTLVFCVMFFHNSFISNHSVSLSISEYIIFAQLCITAFDTDTHVYHETITSSLLLTQIIFNA
jgi:hypothetical protein